ncbi:hypothetical protein LTR10_012232 [Elasticomyces elasticus]|nr:hypothetical protein LTR10_012232 [Elasticomyces elasticus]KAK4965712.1 hypothetical protein LTR42_011725 [Elasticomyces elasticus]
MPPVEPDRAAEIWAMQDAEDQRVAATPAPTAGSPTRARHNEATGRSREPATGVRRGSLIPLDRSRIGYLPMTPANRPELFTRGQAVGIPAPANAAGAGAVGARGMARAVDEEESDSDGDDQLPVQMRPVPWVVGRAPPQPLTYDLPTATGGVERRQILFTVDFSDGDSVSKANKRRNQALVRRQTQLGTYVPARPSTIGREYTIAHDRWIEQTIDNWASDHGGRRILFWELADAFNAQFPGQNRTHRSMASHVNKMPNLRDTIQSYDGAGDEEGEEDEEE